MNSTPIFLGATFLPDTRIKLSKQKTIPTPSPQSPPTHFEGTRLHPLTPNDLTDTLTRHFPGQIATFHSAGRYLLYRFINRATSRLSFCESELRSSGYQISRKCVDSENWLTYFATNDQTYLHVRETITSPTKSFPNPTQWYWHALLHPDSGPWQATTVITPLLDPK